MMDWAEIAALTEQIASHLPALEQRVRKQDLAAVVQTAQEIGDVSPAGFLQLAAMYTAKSKARRARLTALQKAHALAQTATEQSAIIAQELHSENAPARAFSALRRGWLDMDAMAERAELDLHQLELHTSLALRAAAAIVPHEQAAMIIDRLIDFLLTPHTPPRPLCAVACAEALTELLEHIFKPENQDERWQALCELLRDGTLPRRVQAAVARLCMAAVPPLAMEVMGARLLAPAAGDDFLLRQHFVVLLASCPKSPAAFAQLAAHVQNGDPSEHVRIAWPAALRATGGAAAVPLLEELAGVSFANKKGDESPRVRMATAMALAALLRDREADTAAALGRLLADSDPLVYKTVTEEIEMLATDNKLQPAQAADLTAVYMAQVDRNPAVQLSEPAVRAVEALATVAHVSFAAAQRELSQRLANLPLGAVTTLTTKVSPLTFGRLLARHARDGFGYYADAIPGGYRVERGARFVRRAWRLWHELVKHTPYKRQDALHSIGRHFQGHLRAPSGLLAEATTTAVPGEPLTSPRDGTWGQHLPMVDDLLSMPVSSAEPILLFSSRGRTQIEPPSTLRARLYARLCLSGRYAEFAEMRLRSLDPADPSESTRYIESLEALGFRIALIPYPPPRSQSGALVPAGSAPFGSRVSDAGLLPGALALLANPADLGALVRYMVSPAENTLAQLGIAATLIGAAMLFGNIRQRTQIRRNRAAIPLCIGGWGTRGKSGTERLKAAMLHALDLNVLVKTTGCEAMFIHGVPGRRPTEIFIHRSYDKATIWEQRDLLSQAAKLRVGVFLWECMALSEPLVRVLSEEWMNDDLQTLTNAYPDHEDIQGPAGHDVARSIAAFIRSGGTCITTEEQMLPILAEEARRKKARLIIVGAREHLLLGEDLLARFPYREHPRNIALVRRLAVELGLDPDLATADMADHVVPDLGVLKIYPTCVHRGRRMAFVNGMSANERTGFLSNWQRTGCERAADQPGRWVVTVVNNRYDRVARSKAFAEIIVRDASAERHVLIGTNLAGLRVYIDEALTSFLPELRLFRSEDPPARVPALLQARRQRLHHRLRIGTADVQAILAEISSWRSGQDVRALGPVVDAALVAAANWADAQESLVSIRDKLRTQPLAQALETLGGEDSAGLIDYACRSIARRALLASLMRAAELAIGNAEAEQALGPRQDRLYRELFSELVIAVENSDASGDQIIDIIAGSCPPGIDATVMGIQNIKGTGLDFVYRFIRYDEVHALVERLNVADDVEARQIAAALLTRSDFGMLDAALATKAVAAAAVRLAGNSGSADYLNHIAAQLQQISERCQAALKSGKAQRRSPLTRAVEKAFDTVDAVRRRWRAEQILDALVHREISHERAAMEARRLVEREKKGWLRQTA